MSGVSGIYCTSFEVLDGYVQLQVKQLEGVRNNRYQGFHESSKSFSTSRLHKVKHGS